MTVKWKKRTKQNSLKKDKNVLDVVWTSSNTHKHTNTYTYTRTPILKTPKCVCFETNIFTLFKNYHRHRATLPHICKPKSLGTKNFSFNATVNNCFCDPETMNITKKNLKQYKRNACSLSHSLTRRRVEQNIKQGIQ